MSKLFKEYLPGLQNICPFWNHYKTIFSPTIVDIDKIRRMKGEERIDTALSIAKHHFKVPKLLHPKGTTTLLLTLHLYIDFASEHLDMKSVVCYLMTLYLALVRHSGASSIATSSGSTGNTASTIGSGSSHAPSTATMTTVIQNEPLAMAETPVEGSQEVQTLALVLLAISVYLPRPRSN